MIISLHCSAGHFFYSQNNLVLWLHSNPESGYPGLIWSGTHSSLLSWCSSGSVLQQWKTVFSCTVHYLWALNFAWHHVAAVHPSGKSYCLTNLNNCAPLGNVAATLPNSLSRSSVSVFKDSRSSVALEGSHCHLWQWGKLTLDFHVIASWFLDHFCHMRLPGLVA